MMLIELVTIKTVIPAWTAGMTVAKDGNKLHQ